MKPEHLDTAVNLFGRFTKVQKVLSLLPTTEVDVHVYLGHDARAPRDNLSLSLTNVALREVLKGEEALLKMKLAELGVEVS